MDTTKAALAAGIASGYLLGRRRKAKLAVAVATYAVGRRFKLKPQEIAGAGLRRITANPQFAEATERLRGQVLEAGRAAAHRRIGTLADSLREKTEAIGGALGTGQDGGGQDGGGGPEGQDGQEGPESHDTHRHRDRSARRRKAAEADGGDGNGGNGGDDGKDGDDDEAPRPRKQRKKAAAAKAAHTRKAVGAGKRAARTAPRHQRER